MKKTNFGGNIHLETNLLFAPNSEAEVLEILNKHKGRIIRCIGSLHSWSQVLESNDVLLDLRNLNGVHPDDRLATSVEVGAGCQIKRLVEELERQTESTLPSLGFITEQTIAGAISTGTHGSGKHSLSHYVLGVRVARYDNKTGDAVIVDITDGDELRAARCSFGCLGVILSVTMQCRKKYSVEEQFCEYKKLSDVLASEDEFPLQQFYLVPWRWSYIAQHRRETNSRTSKMLWVYHWYRFLFLDIAMHLLILLFVRFFKSRAAVMAVFRWIAPAFVIRNWRVSGPSSSQLIMEHELFRHIEMELFVQRSRLPKALQFLKNMLLATADSQGRFDSEFQEQIADANCEGEVNSLRGLYCHHYPICIRKVLPDNTLISMASNANAKFDGINHIRKTGVIDNEAWYSITLTNYDRGPSRRHFEHMAKALSTAMMQLFSARPHWGKLNPLSNEQIISLYPAFPIFRKVCDQFDKDGVFRNGWAKDLLNK